MTFGQQVREFRTANQWTQKELAKKIGCHAPTISLIERNNLTHSKFVDLIKKMMGTWEETPPPTYDLKTAIIDDSVPVGIQLKQLRKQLGMTQIDVARELGVSSPVIVQWEKGGSPQEKNRQKILNFLKQNGHTSTESPVSTEPEKAEESSILTELRGIRKALEGIHYTLGNVRA
jgi:transcriptional regulator with XRE-family HTH domain